MNRSISIHLAIFIVSLGATSKTAFADDYAELLRSAAADTSTGKYDIAITEYKQALKLRPDAPEALNNLAVVYYQTGKFQEAYNSLSRVWENHLELKSAALVTGLAAIQLNRPRDAIAPLEHLLSVDPANRDALLGMASAQFALHQYSKAVDVYHRETNVAPKDATAWYGLAVCLERLAEDSSRKLSTTPGASSYSKRLLGEYLQSTGDKKLAEEAFGESQTIDNSASPQAADQYRQARDLAEHSKTAFETFVALAPESWQANVFYGDVARQHGDLMAALSHYQKAADAKPASPAPDLGLGTVYWEMGNFDLATNYLHKTLERNPQAMQAIFELANIAVRRHSDSDAIPLLIEYLKSQPDALAAHADLGRAYLHLEQYTQAAAELRKAAAADEQGDVHYQLSIALRKLGQIAEADAALKQSTDIRRASAARDQRLHEVH